jgi:magnesium transporter
MAAMSKKRRYQTSPKPLGTLPGTVTYVGQEIKHATQVTRIEYNEAEFRVDDSSKISLCQLPDLKTPHITWIDVDGIHESAVIERIGQQFHLHPLLLEDVANTEQKPKLETYEPGNGGAPVLFVTMKMLYCDQKTLDIDAEHISFVLGSNFLISFQEERTADIFAPVMARIEAGAGKTRRAGADYLLYSLMDLVVDNYFRVLEAIGESLDNQEDLIIRDHAGQPTLPTLYALKRELALVRRYIWPLREMLATLLRDESSLINPHIIPFLRDLNDHVAQLIETADSYREIIHSLMEVYLSTVSNRMNSVMKTLTIFSAIFMPLTFIVGVYGMNFENMPELKWQYGYFLVLGLMAIVTVGMVIYFRRKNWL